MNDDAMPGSAAIARLSGWLERWLTWRDGQTDLIKTVAALLMVADHLNRLAGLPYDGLMLAGRGAFPLFALAWGRNLARHADIRQSSLNDLWVYAILAQLPYLSLGFVWWQGNILFAFAVTGQALRLAGRPGWLSPFAAALLLLAWMPFSVTSYGLPGVLVLALSWQLYRCRAPAQRVSVALTLAVMVAAMNLSQSVAAGLCGLLLTLAVPWAVARGAPELVSRFLPRGFFPVFYILHLAAAGLLMAALTGF